MAFVDSFRRANCAGDVACVTSASGLLASLLAAYDTYVANRSDGQCVTLVEFMGASVDDVCRAVVGAGGSEVGVWCGGSSTFPFVGSQQCSAASVGASVVVGSGSDSKSFGGSARVCGPVGSGSVVDGSVVGASVKDAGVASCTSASSFGARAGVQNDANVGVSDVRGVNYWRNKRKRDNKKRKMQGDWRSGSDCQKEDAKSDATVVTVDTKMAEELQAKRSLAVRRTMENRVATALAAHKLRTLKDKSRTDAVEKLAAARFEQRINEAKAKSQSSFKQCDQSLKSLGSSGSAGEFALKQEVKRAQDDRKLLDYVQKQLDIAIKCATPAAIAAINALPAPEFQDEFEAFGDCPSDYDEDEAQAYYNQLNARNQELADIANVGF